MPIVDLGSIYARRCSVSRVVRGRTGVAETGMPAMPPLFSGSSAAGLRNGDAGRWSLRPDCSWTKARSRR